VYDFISLPVILRRARKQFKIDDSRLMIPARGIPSSPGDDAFSIAIAPYAFAYLYNRTVPRARARARARYKIFSISTTVCARYNDRIPD